MTKKECLEQKIKIAGRHEDRAAMRLDNAERAFRLVEEELQEAKQELEAMRAFKEILMQQLADMEVSE